MNPSGNCWWNNNAYDWNGVAPDCIWPDKVAKAKSVPIDKERAAWSPKKRR